MAVKTEETEAQRKANYQAVEHRESVAAILAAEAILLPLGFTRRKDPVYFKMDAPGRVDAEWNLKDPEITAYISRQSRGWNSDMRGDGSFSYRLVLSGRNLFSRDPRLSPGNRPGVLDYIEKVKAALSDSAAYDKKLEKLLKEAKSLIADQFPNLKITKIEVEHDDHVQVRVKTKAGGQFYMSLDGSLNFVSLTVSEDGSESVTIGQNLRRALGAL